MAIRFLLGNMFKIGTLQGERIAAPVCALARNDREIGAWFLKLMTLPPGEGIVRHSSLQTPICQCAYESRQPERSIVSFSQHTARFAMCQAIFAMKFAKKYAIIVNVNKNRQFSSKNHSDLYNVHKNTVLIL